MFTALIKKLVGLKNELFADSFTIPHFLSAKYISSLNGIRACAILIVIAAHLNANTFHNNIIYHAFNGGLLGVDFFFVLSGFLITSLLIKEKVATQTISLKKFYIRRALRILPVAFLFIIVVIILNHAFDLGVPVRSFIYQATFTVNLQKTTVRPWYTAHFWSLGIEEQFYLIFPFLFKKSFRLYFLTAVALIILSPVVGVAYGYVNTPNLSIHNAIIWSNLFLNQGFCAIIVGSLMAILVFKFPLKINIGYSLAGIIQCVLLYFTWFFFSYPMSGGINSLIEYGFIAVFILSVVYFKSIFHYVFNLKGVATLGVLSYSIYIWQQLFTNEQPWKAFAYGTFIPLNMAVLCIVAYASYHYFEKPFLVLKNRFKIT